MAAYYNEIDKFAAAWLRELVAAGLIAEGEVDDRSIEDVTPNDLVGFTQCHFFAGIGGWSLALRLAGIPDDYPVWTGSCPCQPFSQAGAGAGFADERHLWPAFGWLIQQCRPAIVFGEQVASKAADAWIDLVHADLEAMDYAFGCVPFPAAGIGAPHIRDRNYWVGNRLGAGLEGFGGNGDQQRRPGWEIAHATGPIAAAGTASRLADTDGRDTSAERQQRGGQQRQQPQDSGASRMADSTSERRQRGWAGEACAESSAEQRPERLCDAGGVADTGHHDGTARPERREHEPKTPVSQLIGSDSARITASPTNGFLSNPDWLLCRDGKWRAVEPGTFPLAHGVSNRVGRLRGYGNAIVPPQAAEFIRAAIGVAA